jgi:hypothetical protein
LCTYFPSRVLFLRCVFSRFFVLSRHRHRCFPFFFFALELTPDFLFYLRLLLPFPSSLKRGGGLQRFLSSTCCVVRSDEFPLHEFFFLGYCEFSDTKNYSGEVFILFFLLFVPWSVSETLSSSVFSYYISRHTERFEIFF